MFTFLQKKVVPSFACGHELEKTAILKKIEDNLETNVQKSNVPGGENKLAYRFQLSTLLVSGPKVCGGWVGVIQFQR